MPGANRRAVGLVKADIDKLREAFASLQSASMTLTGSPADVEPTEADIEDAIRDAESILAKIEEGLEAAFSEERGIQDEARTYAAEVMQVCQGGT